MFLATLGHRDAACNVRAVEYTGMGQSIVGQKGSDQNAEGLHDEIVCTASMKALGSCKD